MQKVYLKYKDKWWTILVALLFYWAGNKLLDILISLNVTNYFVNKVFTLLNYKIPFSSALLGIVCSVISFHYLQSRKIKNRKLKIKDAIYGYGQSWISITEELNNSVIDDKLNIVLSNNIAGDPVRGQQKVGRIIYEFNGSEYQKTFLEGNLITLPVIPAS